MRELAAKGAIYEKVWRHVYVQEDQRASVEAEAEKEQCEGKLFRTAKKIVSVEPPMRSAFSTAGARPSEPMSWLTSRIQGRTGINFQLRCEIACRKNELRNQSGREEGGGQHVVQWFRSGYGW